MSAEISPVPSDEEAVASGSAAPQPLVLHVNVGDCVSVDLSNRTGGPVSFHADMLAFDPQHFSISPREAAYAISYALGDRGPDAALVRAAEDGALSPRAAAWCSGA